MRRTDTPAGLKAVALFGYASPAICSVLSFVFCGLEVWRFTDGKTVRTAQSVYQLAASATAGSKATLADATAEKVDKGLAGWLQPSAPVIWIILILTAIFSFWLIGFAVAALSHPSDSREANRIKVWFRLLFPSRFLQFLLPWLSCLPLCLPYYVANRFAKYYPVREQLETTVVYNDWSVFTKGFSPLLAIFCAAVVSTLLFFFAGRAAAENRLDLYTRYEPPAEKPVRVRGGKRS